MRGVFTDQINIDALTRPSLIDSFYDDFNNHPVDASSPEMADALVAPSIWDRWATPEFDRLLSYHFLDEVSPTHPLIDGLIDDWRPQFNEISNSTDVIVRMHQLFLPMIEASSLHARTLLNIEVSMIIRMAELQGVSMPDVHAYDAMDVFQQSQFGLCWPTADGWLSVPFGGSGVAPLSVDQFLSMELMGRNPCMVHPNGVRSLQPLQVVDAMNQQVIDIVRDVFSSFDGLGVQDIIQHVRDYMQSYDYIADHEHEWQSLDVIFSQQGGDCEDLAHLEASLLIRALEDAGFSDVSNSIEFMTGLVGEGMTQFGHTVIQLNFNGQTFVIDSTLPDGMISRDVYNAMYGFQGLMAYSTTSSDADILAAMAIDTSGNLASLSGSVQDVKNDFLEALGMKDYYNAFKEYYPAVTDRSQNPDFWAAASSGSDQAQQALADSGVTQPAFESIDFDEPVYVGETLRYYDTKSGLAGLMERIDHRVDEMSVNLTNQTMNQYVGQTYNGYYMYDYSRIMSDYTNILDLIQTVTGYLTAITTYCNAFNWIASQLSYDHEPNSEIKARQRLVKSVQGVLLKMVDEVEYFIPLFTQTYDDLNQGIYSKYKDEVTMEFQNISSNLKDVFTLGAETIRRHKMMEKIEAEYWYVAVKNREKFMQSNVTVPHSRALVQFLNFSDPYSNILGAEPGSARSFADFHSNMELDILAGVFKPIQVLANGALETRYISALHYYLPWYFEGGDILAYTDALGNDQDISFLVSDVDMFAYNSLRDVFAPTGLNAMKNEFGFFVREPWLTNLDIQTGNNVDATNFKSTKLYKFLYANAFKFNAMFEIEAYKQGYETNYYAGSGKFLDDPQSMVQMMARKRRLSPLDFADILDINIDKTSDRYGEVSTNGNTSEGVWKALKDAGYINQYGLFEKTMADKLFNSTGTTTIDNLFGTETTQINIESALTDDDTLRKKIAQRIYDIFSVDDYQFSMVQYDYSSRPQLFVRATPNLINNGYVDMFGNEAFSRTRPTGAVDDEWGYKFLNDEFDSGESQASKNANEAAKSFIDTAADEASAPAPVFTDSYLTNWGIYSSSTVNIEQNSYSVHDVRTYLYNNLSVQEGRNFFSNVVLSAAEQKAFYDQYLISVNDRPEAYAKYAGTTFGAWGLPNFVDNPPVAAAPQPYALGGASAPVSGIATVVLPSASPNYSYDYGLMEKLPFDTRIVSESTESSYATQGGKVIGTIQYVDYEDRGVDTSDVNHMGKIKVHESDYAQETIDSLNNIRSSNSLEKPLTPVQSYNDESVVFSAQDISNFTGLTRNSDEFNAFMEGMIASGYAKPVFQRIKDTSGGAHLSNVGKYQLMGYTFLSTFFSGTPTVVVSGKSPSEMATIIENLRLDLDLKYKDEWRLNTKLDMFQYFYTGDDFRESGFLEKEDNQYQLLRWVGEDVENNIHGLDEATPFMSYEWHLLKSAHNGMISTQSRVRIFYFVIQAYVSSIQTIANKLDHLAYKGTGSIEADLQMFEKRVGKQLELFAQINAKTNAFVQINNSYYKQKLETIKASDLGIRIAKGIELYGGLSASVVYLVAQGLRATAAAAGPALGAAILATAEAVEKVSAGMMIVAGAATVTQRAIALAHEYGIPQKMTADLFAKELNATLNSNDLKNQARTDFKNITGYKSPVTFDNGNKWVPNLDFQALDLVTLDDINSVYTDYSPYTNTEYTYAHEGGFQDVWQSADELLVSQSGDCEDYAVLAASLLVSSNNNNNNFQPDHFRIVNGILGYGGHAPVSHTVVLYDETGSFSLDDSAVSGKMQFSSSDIQVIDLVAPRKSDGTNFTYTEYQNQYGFFQPVYSYDSPGASTANLGYGFQDFEVFGYSPSAAFAPPTTPKGPLDLGPYSDGFDPPYFYKIEQTTARRSKLLIYSDSGATNLVETRSLPNKIEYGQRTLRVMSPSGTSVELTLHGNFDTNSPYTQGSSLEDLKNQAKDEAGSFMVPIDEGDIDVAAVRGTSSDQPVSYQSKALILPGGSGGAGGGVNHGDLVIPGMKNLLLLEMEEHAVLQEMHELALNPIDFSTENKGYYAYDWPTFQHLQRRLFLIQQKMKKSFLVMKLKAEFLSLIGTRLGDLDRQQMSGAMDSIFQSHFSQMSHSVEAVQLMMQSMESIHQSNYEVENQRERKVWDLAFTTLVEGIMAGVALISISGPPTASVVKPILNVLFKFIEFFGNHRNPFYFKNVEEIRHSTKMVDGSYEFNALKDLFNITDPNNNYDNVQNTIYDATGKVPYNKDALGNTNALKTQNEIFQDPDIEYTLTIDEVVNEYWNVNNKGYNSPTLSDIYKGQIQYADGPKSINEFPNESLEDYVMQRMSSRYFSESGDDLMFLNGYIYSMSGTKLFLDEDFFDWIQQRLSAEMMNQIYFSMTISSIRSITSNLGYSGMGGNDAIQTASALTSEIGNHYFQIQTTLGAWESLQLSMNELRFSQFKQLDRLILEGIISIATAAVSVGSAALGKLAATGASKLATITKVALQILSSVTLASSEMTSQLTDIIYSAVDAAEENKVMRGVQSPQNEMDADIELQEKEGDTEAQRIEKQLRRERKSVGEESLKTAGNTTTGFGSTFVDQSKKVKMKRQIQELFKMMEVSQKVNESRSEFIKSLASNLGYSTAQANVGGSLSSIQGMAKQASDKAVDARFAILEASAKRANSISSAMRNMIMAVATVAASVFVNQLFKGANKKMGASSKNKRSVAMNDNMKKLAKSVLNLAITAVTTGVALDEMKRTREANEAENKTGKSEMSQSVGDAASSDRGQQLSGLERRAINAQMNLGMTQESQAINKVITEMNDKLGAAITETLKAMMALLKGAVDKESKARKPKGMNAVADVDADYQKELNKAGGNEESVRKAKSRRNERMKGVMDQLKGNQYKPIGLFGGLTFLTPKVKKELKDSTGKVVPKTDAQLDQEFDDLSQEMMDFAQNEGQSSDSMKGKSYNELEKLASNPNAPPQDRDAARNAMISKALPSLKLLGKAKEMMKGGWRSRFLGVLLALVGLAAVTLNVAFLPMIQHAFKNVLGGESESERAESINGAAVAMAFANERGRGMGDEASDDAGKARRQLMAKNPGIVREVLDRQSSRESRLRLRSRMPAGTAGKALQDMMSSKDPLMSGLAAQIVAGSPGSVQANMENAMDAFKDDNKKLLDFMSKVSDLGPAGAKKARQMMDSVNGRSGVVSELKGSWLDFGGDDAAKGMSQRMQQMLSTPSSAKRIAAIRAKGLSDDERVGHHLLNRTNGMVRQLEQLIQQIKAGNGSTAKTELGPGKESDVVQSMIQLFSEGDSATDQLTLEALNSHERRAITDVLQGLMAGASVKGGQRAGHNEDLVREELIKALAGASPVKQQRIKALAKQLSIDMTGASGIKDTTDKEEKLGNLLLVAKSENVIKENQKTIKENQKTIEKNETKKKRLLKKQKKVRKSTRVVLFRGEIKTLEGDIKALEDENKKLRDKNKELQKNKLNMEESIQKMDEFFNGTERNLQGDSNEGPPSLPQSLSPTATPGDTSNRSKAAALMLSNIAEHAGLFAENSRQPVDETLVRKDGKIQIDQPGEVVRKIIQAVNDSTDSAGAAGYVKDFLLAVGIQVGDSGHIHQVVQNPQELFSLTSTNKENVKKFLMPVATKAHTTTDMHNNVKPQEKEYIKRFVQVAMRAAGVELAIPFKTQQVDPKAQIGYDSGPGNVSWDPDVASAPKRDSGATRPYVARPEEATSLAPPGESSSTNTGNSGNTAGHPQGAGEQPSAAQAAGAALPSAPANATTTGQTLTQMAEALITNLNQPKMDPQSDQSQQSDILRRAVEEMGAKISDDVASKNMNDDDFKAAMMRMLDAGVPEAAVFAVFDNIQEVAGDPMDIKQQMAAIRPQAHHLFQVLLEEAGTRESGNRQLPKDGTQPPDGLQFKSTHGEAFGHFVSQNPSFMSDVGALAKAGKQLPVDAGMAMFGISDQMALAACRDGVLGVLTHSHPTMDALNVAVQDLKTLCRAERNELNARIPSGDAKIDQPIRHNIRTLTEAIDGIETFQAMDRPTALDAKIAIATVLSNADSKQGHLFGGLPNQLDGLAKDIGQSINQELKANKPPKTLRETVSKTVNQMRGTHKPLMRSMAALAKTSPDFFTEATKGVVLREGDMLKLINNQWSSLSTADQANMASQLIARVLMPSETSPGLSTDALSKKCLDAIGDQLVQLVADGHMGLSQLTGAIGGDKTNASFHEQIATIQKLTLTPEQKSQFKAALGLATIMSGNVTEIGGIPEKLTAMELATTIQYVPNDRLAAFYNNSAVAQNIHQKLGVSDAGVLNNVLARQISDNPDLGAALFSHLGAESRTSITDSTPVGAEKAQALGAADASSVRQPSATPPGGVHPPSGPELGSGFRHLFELLPAHVQRDTMGQLTDLELRAFLEQTKNNKGKVSLDVLSAIADSNPTVLNQWVKEDDWFMDQLTEFLNTSKDPAADVQGEAVQDPAADVPAAVVQVIQSLTVENAGQCAKFNDIWKAAIKTHHPVGYMGSILAEVRRSPGLDVVLDAYGLTLGAFDGKTGAEKMTFLTNAFERLGRAGNQNPEMMSQLLSELTVQNMGSSELLRLIKDAMVGAMFKDNSLNVCLTLDHLPQNIQDQLTSLSKNDALRDAFQAGLNEYDQTRFDGLKFGLSAASLTSHNAHEWVASKRVLQFDLVDAKDVRDCLLNFDPTMIGANDIPDLKQFLTKINNALETSSKGLTTDLSALKTLVCARGYALTQSIVQATSSDGSTDGGDAPSVSPSGDPSSGGSSQLQNHQVFKDGLGVGNLSFEEQVPIINQKIDEAAVVVLGMRSTTPIGDFFRSNDSIVRSSRDVKRHRFTTLKSQVNMVNEKTHMDVNQFMATDTPLSNDVEAALFLDQVMAQHPRGSEFFMNNGQPDMSKLTQTFARFKQVQAQFPHLRTESVKAFEKQMAEEAVKGDDRDFMTLFYAASVGAQQQLMATMAASDDGTNGLKNRAQALKAHAFASLTTAKLHAPSADFVQSSDIDHAQHTMMRHVDEALATLPEDLKQSYIDQLTQHVGRLPFNEGPAKNSVMLARLRGIQQAAQKDRLNTAVFDQAVSQLLGSMSVDQLPLSNRSMDHLLTFMIPRSKEANVPFLNHLLEHSPKDFDRLQARASIHSNGVDMTKAMSDIRSQHYRSGENIPSFVVIRASSNIAKMSYKNAVRQGIELANNQELSDTAKGDILAQLMMDSPTNFLAVMEGLQSKHISNHGTDPIPPEDRMVASGMHRIANDPGLYRLFTNIQHGNFSGRSSSSTMDYIESMMDKAQYVTEFGMSTLTHGYMDGSNAGRLTRGIVGAGALTVGIAASPLYGLVKVISQVGAFIRQKCTDHPKPLKIRGAGSRQQIMRQVVGHLADHSSSMGTVNTMLIGQGVNRHRDTINLMASIGPDRMATMVKERQLKPQAMTSMVKSVAALSMHDNKSLSPYRSFSPNEIFKGSDISRAIKTLKSALTTAAEMGSTGEAPGDPPSADGLPVVEPNADAPSEASIHSGDFRQSGLDAPIHGASVDSSPVEEPKLKAFLTPEQVDGMNLLTSALQVSPQDLGITEDDSKHPEVQEFMDRMAHHAFDAMRAKPDQMAQTLNAMFEKSPAMKGVALAALPRGDNSGLLKSLSQLADTPHKPALQAMACLIRPVDAECKDKMSGGSGIRFNVEAAAQYLSSTQDDHKVAIQFVKAMNDAIDHGLVSNTELHELYQKTDMESQKTDMESQKTVMQSLIEHCLVLKDSDSQQINKDLMKLIPKVMGSVAKYGKHPMDDLKRVFEQIDTAVAGNMPGGVESPSGSAAAPDSDKDIHDLKKQIVRQMQNHMVVDGSEFQSFVRSADQRATFTDAFGQALEARIHRFSKTDSLSPMDQKLGAMYQRLIEFQKDPNNIKVRKPGEFYGTQPAHEPTVRDLFASHELDPQDVQHLLAPTTEDRQPGTSFSKTFNTMLNTRIRDVVYYNSPHHQWVRTKLNECRQMVQQDGMVRKNTFVVQNKIDEEEAENIWNILKYNNVLNENGKIIGSIDQTILDNCLTSEYRNVKSDVLGILKEIKDQDQAPFYRGVQEVMAYHVGGSSGG